MEGKKQDKAGETWYKRTKERDEENKHVKWIPMCVFLTGAPYSMHPAHALLVQMMDWPFGKRGAGSVPHLSSCRLSTTLPRSSSAASAASVARMFGPR